MTQSEMTQNPENHAADTDDNGLIRLENESTEVGRAQDINRKIDMLDGSLGKLNAELESIRASVEQGLDRLSDNDIDLTAKVSDTYKRLGELDNTYRALTEISRNIDSEIKKLTADISQVATQSSAELEKLEATSEVHNSYLTRQHETLAQRVEKLVEDSQHSREQLQRSIGEVREKMLQAEQKLLAEIDALASNSQQQDEILATNIDLANAEIETSKARIIKLQQVDEAMHRRAGELEQSARTLEKKTDQLGVSIAELDSRTGDLGAAVTRLQQHTAALQRESEHHSSLIETAQKNLNQLAQKLLDLGGTERRHFRMTSLALAVLAVLLVGFYVYQFEENSTISTSLHKRTDGLVAQLNTVDNKLQAVETGTHSEISQLKDKLVNEVETLSRQLAHIDNKVMLLDEQAQSLDGRLNAAGLDDGFGGDNILHGPQWLAQQSAQRYTIQIAVVQSRQQMFDITQRYGDQLTEPLAYYADGNGRFVLLYGQFDSDRVALNHMQGLPYRINWQQPVLRSVGSVQAAM